MLYQSLLVLKLNAISEQKKTEMSYNFYDLCSIKQIKYERVFGLASKNVLACILFDFRNHIQQIIQLICNKNA